MAVTDEEFESAFPVSSEEFDQAFPKPKTGLSGAWEKAGKAIALPFKAAGYLDEHFPLPGNKPRSHEEVERRAESYGNVTRDMLPFLALGPAGTAAKALRLPGVAGALAAPVARVASSGAISGTEAGLEGKPVLPAAGYGALGAGLAEGLSAAAGPVVGRIKDMAKFKTINPRAAGRMAAAEEAEAKKAALRTARETNRGNRDQWVTDARLERERARQATTTGRQRAEQTAETAGQMARGTKVSQTAHRMSQVFPELEVQGPEFWGMTKDWGRAQIRRVMDSSVAEIEQRIGPRATFQIPELADKPMTFREAWDELQQVGQGIGKVAPGDRSASQRFSLGNYRTARQSLVDQLNRWDGPRGGTATEGAGDIFDAANKRMAASRAYLGVIAKSLDRTKRFLDPDRLAVNVNEDFPKLREKFGPYWDEAERAMLGAEGAPAGVTGTMEPLYPPATMPQYPPRPASVQPQMPPPREPSSLSEGSRTVADIAAQYPQTWGAAAIAAQILNPMQWVPAGYRHLMEFSNTYRR